MICLVIFISSFSFAGGTLQLSGSVHSFDSQTISVNDGIRIYKLEKSKLGGGQSSEIAKAQIGKNLKLVVPFDAVIDVRSKK